MNAPITEAEWIAIRDEKMLGWMAGSQVAVDAVHTITEICDVWDDLVDCDQAVTPEEVNAAFVKAMVTLHMNPFYKANEAAFLGIIVVGVNAWMDANALQSAPSDRERMLSFYIRTFIFEVVHLAAFLVGGWDHMRRVSLEMRMFFENETYAEWEHRLGGAHGME